MIPTGFIEEMRLALGPEEAERLCRALEEEPTVAVRLNPAKLCDLPPELAGEPVEWHGMSRRLATRPSFTLMPQLHAGAFYVQDPSSMIIARVVSALVAELPGPVRMLDACAAPGGKTTAAIDVLPEGSLMISNEYDSRRASVLAENVQKWGSPHVVVTQGDTAGLGSLKEAFDIVLVDAPCSGEGMMRKDNAAREQWSPGLVRQCSELQREIVDNLWPSLRPGGYMIYATCTFNLEENERRVESIMEEYAARSIAVELPQEWGIGSSRVSGVHALRFMPHITRGEGLFMSVLRKSGKYEAEGKHKSSGKRHTKNKVTVPDCLRAWIDSTDDFEFRRNSEGEWIVFPSEHIQLLHKIESCTSVIHAGLPLAVEKGKDMIPSHALALSRILNREAFPSVELDERQALDYLRKEAVTLPAGIPRGYVLASYAGMPLGFMKNLGNRSNNLYPSFWRIRHL